VDQRGDFTRRSSCPSPSAVLSYSKRDCSLPPGCKDLIDVIRLEANWKTFFDCYGKLTYRPESAESSCAENAMQFECNSIEYLPQSQTDFSASQITRCDLTG